MNINYISTKRVERKSAFARFFLISALIAGIVLPSALYTGVLACVAICLMLLSNRSAVWAAIKLSSPFIVMGVVGYLASGQNQTYEIVKDVWYISKVILTLFVGFLLGARDVDRGGVNDALVMIGIFGAVLVLIVLPVFYDLQFLTAETEDVAKLPLVSLLAVPVLLERIRLAGWSMRWRDGIVLLAIILAAVISDSRITLIAILLILASWIGLFATPWRSIKGAALLIAAGFLAFQALPDYNGGELTAFNKLKRSLEEMAFTDAYDSTSMIMNWRGFEAYNAQIMFDNGSVAEKIFGFGLGAEVDLGLNVQMSQEMNFRYLPTLHNGYYFLIIKFGLLGFIIYILSLFSWFKWKIQPASEGFTLDMRILRGSILVIFASTAVITGLFNKFQLHGLSLVVAYILGHVALRRTRTAHASTPPHPAMAPVSVINGPLAA